MIKFKMIKMNSKIYIIIFKKNKNMIKKIFKFNLYN